LCLDEIKIDLGLIDWFGNGKMKMKDGGIRVEGFSILNSIIGMGILSMNFRMSNWMLIMIKGIGEN